MVDQKTPDDQNTGGSEQSDTQSTPSEPVTISERGSIVQQPNTVEKEKTSQPDEHAGDRFYVGRWSGVPNYGCPYCQFKSILGPWAVDEHIYDWHPEKSGLDFGEDIDGGNNG